MIKLGGRFAPRSLWFGFEVSAAQSRGENPGSRTARCEAFLAGLRVTGVGDREFMPEAGRLPCGTRRDDAADGGGLRVLLALGLAPGRGGSRPAGGERVFCGCGRCCFCSVGGCSLEGGGGGGIKEASFATGGCAEGLGFGLGSAMIFEGVDGVIDGGSNVGIAIWGVVSCCAFWVAGPLLFVSSSLSWKEGTSKTGMLDADAFGVV